ncbi:tetraacyldisaccharide 4'-kinase [Sinomicrobium oceani]|uniref:tetraacyldisaccharide 4'-kinase n=1 Tax=Sinomicrobium oceani TaxID=1150368 RepID=UPI00227BAE89|nr:tetraacyldisaccharide 4'-kinase [Sinomicrobium oceani]
MQKLRKILWPFSLLYGGVVKIRNIFFDRGIFRSFSFDTPIICVGNLSVGGTGKTPMVEYLLRLLQPGYKVATLSRGYKRKSKGFVLAGPESGVESLGDEPCQYHAKFPGVTVAVDADRVHGIHNLLQAEVAPDVIILDDAFQHRKVQAGLNIVLTAYDKLYVHDMFLPAGDLRDDTLQARRAHIIIVTKCPEDLGEEEKEQIVRSLAPGGEQRIFFTAIAYGNSMNSREETLPLNSWKGAHFTLVTGIANPAPLVEFLRTKGMDFEHLNFPDHHNFSEDELYKLRQKSRILTTEKDFMRLQDKVDHIFFLGIRTAFLFGDGEKFNAVVSAYVSGGDK